MQRRCRGGGDRAAGAKQKKPPARDNSVRAFEEAAKTLKAEKTAAQSRAAAETEPQETMGIAQLQARREQLRLEGDKKERERLANTRAEQIRHTKEETVKKYILSTLAINETLSLEEEEEVRIAVNQSMHTITTQRVPGSTKLPYNSEETMMTLLIQPEARESITILLRTRGENLQIDTGNNCPSEIDINVVCGPLSRRVRVLTLPGGPPQEQNRKQGTDFQVALEREQHGVTDMIRDNTLSINGWVFDLIVDPPGTERVLLSPTHQENNQAKFLTFITTIRGLRSNGNEDTKIELTLLQGLKEAWAKEHPSVALIKPPASALGIKATEAARIFLHLGRIPRKYPTKESKVEHVQEHAPVHGRLYFRIREKVSKVPRSRTLPCTLEQAKRVGNSSNLEKASRLFQMPTSAHLLSTTLFINKSVISRGTPQNSRLVRSHGRGQKKGRGGGRSTV